MLLKLTNALVSFQEYIDKMLIKKLDIFIIVYLDNIFINIDNDRNDYIATV